MSLLAHYTPEGTRFDEMVDPHRVPRPHWRPLLTHLADLPAETMRRRSQFVNDAIESDGVTYNAYADPRGTSRAWELDVMPLVLPADEWRAVSAAVAQRARLLDAILGDLYGEQKLMAEGLLPPALVFGQRTFLWPAHGVAPPDGVSLHVYAADLARAPDGRFWVLADRTRGPAGAGYALQNRMTLSRAFPDAFRELQVEQLAPFFGALRESLYRLAQSESSRSGSRDEPPLAVLLTPGPYNETYFEHSFLAKYMGFPLVEGQDLIVRGDRIYLKTLRGLRRVHAILRRLDDDFCDPVELRADSALGVPGLLHVVRKGNVVVANALGSAVLETGALSGFYPAVAKRLFGEELLMPSIATWWCGEAPALEYVLSHLDELVVKPAYPSIRMQPVFGHSLDRAAREKLEDRIRKQPHAYVAQEWIRLSQAPTWSSEANGLVPRATTLRVFAVATPNGYVVMPGGLARVAPQDGDVVSMQWGGSSKDTWTLGEGATPRAPMNRPRLVVSDVAKSVVDIPSRVGENLFWMGRYAERCESIARLLRAALVRLADSPTDEEPALRSLARVAERLEVTTLPRSSESSPELPVSTTNADFLGAAVDGQYPGGLVANVGRLHGCASHVRERMSTDNWHLFNRLPQRLPGKEASLGAALTSLDDVMMACVSLAGFAMDDMTRDESWQFLLLGRRLERLAHLAGVISHVLTLPAQDRSFALEWLLEAANSIVTFRARYRREPELLPVLHLVVFDETNPHAVAFQVRELLSTLARVSEELGGDRLGNALAPLALELRRARLDGFEPESGEVLEGACLELAQRLGRIEQVGFSLSDEVQRRFFTHAGTPVPLGIEAP